MAAETAEEPSDLNYGQYIQAVFESVANGVLEIE